MTHWVVALQALTEVCVALSQIVKVTDKIWRFVLTGANKMPTMSARCFQTKYLLCIFATLLIIRAS